jgi:hypothetical protein
MIRLTSIVRVGTANDGTASSDDTINNEFARASIATAVSAASPELSKVRDKEVLDDNGTLSVHLNDLVGSTLGTTTGNVRSTG